MKRLVRLLALLLICTFFLSCLAGCGSSVELKSEKLHVKPGQTVQIKAEAEDRPLKYESSDPSIASVDENGRVSGITEGPVTITVTNSRGKSAACQVIVDRIEPSSISLQPSSFTIAPNEVVATELIIQPENTTYYTVSYTSDDNSIAKVDRKGLIKGVAAGRTVIRATTGNGKSAQCSVTVRPYAESISIEPSLKMQINDTDAIKVTPVPSNSVKENYIWTTSDSSVAVVENGNVTAVGPGSAAITVMGETSGCYAACVVSVIPEPFTISKITNTIYSSIEGLDYEITYYVTVDVEGGTAPFSYKFDLIQNNEVTATTDWLDTRSSSGYAFGDGTCVLRVTVMDANGYFATDSLDLLNM